MSITELCLDVKEHFQRFERVDFKAAWTRPDARLCLIWCLTGPCLFLLTLGELPNALPMVYLLSLLLIVITVAICALRFALVVEDIRAEALGAVALELPASRLRFLQEWLCGRYGCTPAELVTKARELRHLWEEREDIKRLANNDTMGPRLAAFFSWPDSARLISTLIGVTAIIAALMTLGSSIDTIFEALEGWQAIGKRIALVTFLLTELVLLWITTTALLRNIGPSMLQQLGLLQVTRRRVYRYLFAIHAASEPIAPPSVNVQKFFALIPKFFIPLPTLGMELKRRLA